MSLGYENRGKMRVWEMQKFDLLTSLILGNVTLKESPGVHPRRAETYTSCMVKIQKYDPL